ncbi:uncharacterized protein LOC111131413 [Crassostrea virginica]
MVSKTSEYQREYRPASLVKNIPTYYESLTYRHHRRELEFAHTPISWDFDQDSKCDSPEDDDIPLDKLKIDDKLDENGQTEKENVDDKTNDTDKDVEKDEENLEDIEEEEETADNIEQNKSDVLVLKQTKEGREMTKLAKEKLKKYSSSENKNTGKLKPSQDKKKVTEEFLKPKQVDEKTFLKRPKRPDRASQAPPRPKTAASASVPRPLSSASPRPSSSASCDRPPFVLYGSGDTELQTGSKRTHNVHCSTDIYPAAVKARQQHYLRAKRLEDLRKKILIQKRKHKNSFTTKLSKETTAWKSEYQNQYPTYDNEEYARRLRAIDSARARKVKCDL